MSPSRASWLVFFGLVAAARGADPDPELVYSEKALREAGVETTGPAVLRYLCQCTLTEEHRARLAADVRRLGDDDFDVREKAVSDLVRAGHRALPFLRPVLGDTDIERARRAAECVRQIERLPDPSRVVQAVRVLADRRPEGAVAALLAYLPADDEASEDAVMRALLVLGVGGGGPDAALVKALDDKEPMRRAAAAHVLGRAAPGQRGAVRKLFGDADARVRLEAADALVRAGEKDAVPALIALLADGTMAAGYRAQETLFRLAGDRAPAAELADERPAKRAAVADAWRAWWKDAAPTADLAALNLERALQGVNVCGEADGPERSRVWACRADGKPLWEIRNLAGVTDVQLLPNGHVLVAEWTTQRVAEHDREGAVVWTKQVDDPPTSCRRLPTGNTFIATLTELMEVDPKGRTVYSHRNPAGGLIYRAHRLTNRHILFACQGDKLVELDAAGREVRTVVLPTNTNAWAGVEPLPGDRFLVAVRGADRVIEIDAAGHVLWECPVQDPRLAVRLPNGNTLVSCYAPKCAVEFDRTGKVVWKLKTGYVSCVRRY
jgi:hypothetical protein